MGSVPHLDGAIKLDTTTPSIEHSLELSSVESRINEIKQRRYLTDRDIYQDYMDLVVANTASEVGYLHLYDEAEEQLALNVWSTSVYASCTTSTLSHYPLRNAGIWADAIRKRKTVVHNDYMNQASVQGLPEGHFALIRHMSSPIFWQNKIVAVIGVGNKPEAYSELDKDHLERLSKIGWPVILDRIEEHKQRNQSRASVLDGKDPAELMITMVGTVSKALELRDEYTSHHQSNVAILAESIGQKLELPQEQIFGIRLGAMVHDIGKIAIPAEILSKPGKLNPAELAMVKTHAALGADIFKGVDLPWPVTDIIAQHHERMDGSGYPLGLVGEGICLEARIVAAADTFDAMSSDRPYRRAPGRDAAIEILKGGRGKQYDAYVVDALLAALEDGLIESQQLYGY